jgi:UDP-galactopyranose mutase
MPDLGEMIDGALSPSPKPMGPNARFGYPLRGGFQALMDAFLPKLARPPRLQTSVVAVSPGVRRAQFQDGSSVAYDAMISTMPLPQLIRRLEGEAPLHVRDAARGLKHVSVRCVHLGVARPNLTEKHWIYYPEDPVFHRIFVQGNASPFCNPEGGFGLTCEMTYTSDQPLPAEGDALIERCIADARKVGMLRDDDVVTTATQTDLPYAYVIYDAGRAQRVAAIRAWLSARGIHLAGRYSEWEYYNSDHAFLAGRRAAEDVRAGTESAEEVAEA